MVHQIEVAGLTVPSLGFGTWELSPEDAYTGVRAALDAGYRHVDTAQMYDNEEAVGRAIADSDVDRDDVWLTTKVWKDDADRDGVHRSTKESLDRLGVDHLDLLLLHWPSDDVAPMEETLGAFTELRDDGVTRAIGVSNFPSKHLARAFELAPIVTDQVEHHPYLAVDPIKDTLRANGGFLTAFSPNAKGEVLDDETLREIGEEHDKNAIQVTLRWLLQRSNTATLPRSHSPEHIEANAQVSDFELPDEEVARIDGLASGYRIVDPPFAPTWD